MSTRDVLVLAEVQRDALADISLARKIIGFEPVVKFDEGLRRAIEWYRENL